MWFVLKPVPYGHDRFFCFTGCIISSHSPCVMPWVFHTKHVAGMASLIQILLHGGGQTKYTTDIGLFAICQNLRFDFLSGVNLAFQVSALAGSVTYLPGTMFFCNSAGRGRYVTPPTWPLICPCGLPAIISFGRVYNCGAGPTASCLIIFLRRY